MDTLDIKSLSSFDNKSQSSGGQLTAYQNSKDNVKVIIRVRPLNERERGNGGHKKCVSIENQTTIQIEAKPDLKSFNFDYVADEEVPQDIIFNQIAKPIADCCLEGYNGSIFAYGQTGAGKTFTIQGPSMMVNGEETIYGSYKKDGSAEQEKRGIMQRSFEYIFDCILKAKTKAEEKGDGSHFEYLIRCSYLEIYNEQIMDLLEPSSVNLHVREDIKKGVYVEGLQEEVVSSADDMIQIISSGAKNRHVGSTSMNKESSRSHSVLTTIIETKSMEAGGVWNIKTSRFHIIDLAGSERSKYTNAVGDRLKEAGMINKSLSALGNVINSLVDISEGKSRHVHYRDSKLTFLLRDSLGGNSKTLIVANISPSTICYGETLSTLKFAQRAKLIRNKAVINEDSSGTISLLKGEISRLKKELAESEKRMIIPGDNFQCQVCKSIMGNEGIQDDEESHLLDDEMLISFDHGTPTNDYNVNGTSGPLNEALKEKFKHQKVDLLNMKKRVVHLEGLLSANLDNLTSQQKFYDNEIQKHQQQQKKQQIAIDSYEKQCARDRMIIKFREDRINKLEQNIPQTKDDQQKQIADLKKEVTLWKETVDHNPQAAKLFAEKAELLKQIEQLKTEAKQSPDSLTAQMRSLTELNESLNSYLKQHCEESKNEVEKELSQVKLEYAEKIESLNQIIEEMKEKEEKRKEKRERQSQEYEQTINNLKQELQKMEEQHQQDKLEQEKVNSEAIEQIKVEIEQICENKTEQERELQLLRVQILERDQQIEREKDKRSDTERAFNQKQVDYQHCLAQLQETLQELQSDNTHLEEKLKQTITHHEHQLDNERKQHQQFIKEQELKLEAEIREIERQLLEQSSERQMLQEQTEQLNDRIISLQQENETVQESLLYKDEQIQEVQGLINEKERSIHQLQQEKIVIQDKLSTEQENSHSEIQKLQAQIDHVTQQKETLEQQLQQIMSDKEELIQAIADIKQEIQSYQLEKVALVAKIESLEYKYQAQLDKVTELEDTGMDKDSHILNLQIIIKQLQTDATSFQEQLQQEQQQTLKVKEQLQKEIARLNEEFQSYKQLYSEEKQDEMERLKQEYETILVNSSQQSEEQHQLISNLRAELTTQISNLTDVKHSLEEKVKSQEQQIIVLINSHQQEKAMIMEQNQLELKSIQQEIEVKEKEQLAFMKVFQDKCEHQVKQKEVDTEDKINKVIICHKEELLHIQAQYQQQIQTIEQEKEQTVSSLQQDVHQIQTQKEQQYENKLQAQHKLIEEQTLDFENKILLIEETQVKLIEALKIEHSEQEKNLKMYIQEIQTSRNDLETQLNTQIESLQNEINDIQFKSDNDLEAQEQVINNLQELISQNQDSIKQLQAQVEENQTLINQQRQQINDLEDQQSLSHRESTSAKQQVNAYQALNMELTQQLNTELQNIENLTKDLHEYKGQVKHLQESLNANQQQFVEELEQKDSEISQMRQDMEELENLNQEKENALYEHSQQIEELQSENLKVKESISLTQQQKEALNENQKELFTLLDQEKQIKTENQLQIEQLQKDLKRQQLLLDETITQLNNEHIRKYQEQEQEHQSGVIAIKQELDSYKQHAKELNATIVKLKQRNEEQNDMLKSSKDTMSMMVQKENELMKELEKNINEFKDQQEKWKKRVTDAKEERDHARKDLDRHRKENENLRELIKLKDRQIEEQQNIDERDKQALERVTKENKDLKNQLTKREFEMKDLVKTLKFYSEEKQRLEKEIEKLHRENDQLIGHKNPSQKIQHHVKIKEENNKLREENFKLQEELRRKIDIIGKQPMKSTSTLDTIQSTIPESQDQSALREDMKKLKKDNITYQETINRMVDHILSQPGLTKAIGISEEVNEKLMQQNGTLKVKKVMEIISLLNNCMQQREREHKDLEREIKKYECRLDISEKEKILCKQQLELCQNVNIGPGYNQGNSTFLKRSPINKELNSKLQQEFMMIQNMGESHQMKQNQHSRIQMEGYFEEKANTADQQLPGGLSKKSPSPIYNFKMQKEKENVQAKRELFANQARSGSARRANSYLANGQQQHAHHIQQKHQ